MTTLTGFITLRAWVEAGRGSPVFRRYDQVDWFIRRHRQELISTGTIIPGSGARPSLVQIEADAFGQAVLRILHREAAGPAQ